MSLAKLLLHRASVSPSVQCRLERSQGSPAARKPEDALSRGAISPGCVSFSYVSLSASLSMGGRGDMQPPDSGMGTSPSSESLPAPGDPAARPRSLRLNGRGRPRGQQDQLCRRAPPFPAGGAARPRELQLCAGEPHRYTAGTSRAQPNPTRGNQDLYKVPQGTPESSSSHSSTFRLITRKGRLFSDTALWNEARGKIPPRALVKTSEESRGKVSTSSLNPKFWV